jgi:hypothetical protein
MRTIAQNTTTERTAADPRTKHAAPLVSADVDTTGTRSKEDGIWNLASNLTRRPTHNSVGPFKHAGYI